MDLSEFIKKYSDQCHRGYCEHIFEMKEGLENGLPIPEGFHLLSDICRYPVFSIFVNEDEKAILQFNEGRYSLAIYDDSVVWEETIKVHRKYFKDQYVTQWFTLVSIEAMDNTELFYPESNYLGGSKGFYATKRFENVWSEYEYSLEDIRKIQPNLQIDKTPWYLIVNTGFESTIEEWNSQIQNPLLSTGDIEMVKTFLVSNRSQD